MLIKSSNIYLKLNRKPMYRNTSSRIEIFLFSLRRRSAFSSDANPWEISRVLSYARRVFIVFIEFRCADSYAGGFSLYSCFLLWLFFFMISQRISPTSHVFSGRVPEGNSRRWKWSRIPGSRVTRVCWQLRAEKEDDAVWRREGCLRADEEDR